MMMRWLFWLLVVLNVFYFVWSQQQVALAPTSTGVELLGGRSDGRDLRLLSESPYAGMRSAGGTAEVGQDVCLFLGSFDAQQPAQALEQRLLSLDVQPAVVPVDAAGGIDYWVYLAPLASRQASVRQLKELQARKIDSYLIGTGDLANGISLGIFPRLDSAQSVMYRLRSAGYEPLLRELPRAHQAFWVRIAPQSRRLVDDGMLQGLARDFPGLEHRLMPCQGVATP
jgi:hypothetical protein